MNAFSYKAMRDELHKIAEGSPVGHLVNDSLQFPDIDDDTPRRMDRLRDQPTITTTTTSEPGEKTPALYPDARTAP